MARAAQPPCQGLCHAPSSPWPCPASCTGRKCTVGFRKTQHLNPHYSQDRNSAFFPPKVEDEIVKSSGCLWALLLLAGRADLSVLPSLHCFTESFCFSSAPASFPALLCPPTSAGATCTYQPALSCEQLQMQDFEGEKKSSLKLAISVALS